MIMGALAAACGGFVAWLVALLLVGCERGRAALAALAPAAAALVARLAFGALDLPELAVLVDVAAFAAMTVALVLHRPSSRLDALAAALAATGLYAALLLASAAQAGLPGLLASLALAAASAVCAIRLQGLMPGRDWQRAFAGEGDSRTSDPEDPWAPRRWQVCAALAVAAVATVACTTTLASAALPPLTRALLALVCVLLAWAAILVACLVVRGARLGEVTSTDHQYLEDVQGFMNVIRSQRHDYNFHVQTLVQLFGSGDVEACRRYVEELARDTTAMNEVLPIHDPATAALVNNFRNTMAREGIELRLDIQNDLSNVVTNVYETNKVIGNLLQNALDETRMHDDKSFGVELATLKRGEYCVISVTNAYDAAAAGDRLDHVYQQGYTTKAGHDGVGLSSVRTLLARQRGVIYARVGEGTIRFTAKIPLRYVAAGGSEGWEAS